MLWVEVLLFLCNLAVIYLFFHLLKTTTQTSILKILIFFKMHIYFSRVEYAYIPATWEMEMGDHLKARMAK
jgi:hypothetical protein